MHRNLLGDVEPPYEERANLAVFITGCDSGFGRALALHLLGRGYTVFAGCLTKEGAASLPAAAGGAASRLHAIACDVTSDRDVDAAVAAVRKWAAVSASRWAPIIAGEDELFGGGGGSTVGASNAVASRIVVSGLVVYARCIRGLARGTCLPTGLVAG